MKILIAILVFGFLGGCKEMKTTDKLAEIPSDDSLSSIALRGAFDSFDHRAIVPREEHSTAFLYIEKDFDFYFERINDRISVDDSIDNYILSYFKKKGMHDANRRKSDLFQNILKLCDRMDKYDVRSFWGIPDTFGIQLRIDFYSGNRLVRCRNPEDSVSARKLEGRSILGREKQWILLGPRPALQE